MNRKLKLKGACVTAFGSQSAAARAIGITDWKLSRLISGFYTPTVEERKAIETGLGINLDDPVPSQNMITAAE